MHDAAIFHPTTLTVQQPTRRSTGAVGIRLCVLSGKGWGYRRKATRVQLAIWFARLAGDASEGLSNLSTAYPRFHPPLGTVGTYFQPGREAGQPPISRGDIGKDE
jgi:hypothetical protein